MKTHYRKVFKSDHLGVADLEEYQEEGMKKFIFTIKEVKSEFNVSVAGRKGNHNIAYFTDPKIKPWVLNATNSKVVRGFAKSPFVEDWSDIILELFIKEKVRAVSGGTTDGIRIKPMQPTLKILETFTEKNFEKANANNATIKMIERHYTITPEMKIKYKEYGAKK